MNSQFTLSEIKDLIIFMKDQGVTSFDVYGVVGQFGPTPAPGKVPTSDDMLDLGPTAEEIAEAKEKLARAAAEQHTNETWSA